ncbi:ribokinase [Halalkalibacter flavus]|uniref:ribokinase n=1 Tax=Halalkalibacter flavus TaxID=3090668 RepID=UPI002FC62051
MNRKPRITVIGSSNVDYVVRSATYPQVGETIIGTSFQEFMGGKGANQAVAAARLGGEVSFISSVGADSQGVQIKGNLSNECVNIDGIYTSPNNSSGIAFINVSNDTNKITVIPGANYDLLPAHIDQQERLIASSDIILVQLEIPLETVTRAMELATLHSIPIILNPAPAQPLPAELIEKTTYLTPNFSEMQAMTGLDLKNQQDLEIGFSQLFKQRVKNIILTRGEDGVLFSSHSSQTLQEVKSVKVVPVDTTGAGDTFNGALAYSLASGNDLEAAIRFSNLAAALSVTKNGAQLGMPTNEEMHGYASKL